MIKLDTVLTLARDGELKQLSDKDKNDKVVIGYINMALIVLYRKYLLKANELILNLDGNSTLYLLNGTDTRVKNNSNLQYDPDRDGDIMQILSAYESNGTKVSINNENDIYSIFTPSHNTIQVPINTKDNYISVIYKPNPSLLELSYTDDGNIDASKYDGATPPNPLPFVELPLTLIEPLLHYVGYRAHGSMNGEINAENNTHYMRFEASCTKILEEGALNLDDVGKISISKKGFI